MVFKNKHTGFYEFPTIPLVNGDTFKIAKLKLFIHLTKEKFKVFYEQHYPSFCTTRSLYDYEREDPKNKNVRGVRTFYYPAYHFRGAPTITPNIKHHYEDFLFTPKIEINRHMDETYYNAIIHGLQEK